MATEDNFIVAIELGSSKVTGIAGRKQPDGAIQILAFAQEPSTSFIRKGRINNVDKMTQCLINMKKKLEDKLQKSISRVYVGIGGMGMHTVANNIVRRFEGKMQITQEMIDTMKDENRTSAGLDREILESIPQEYRLGTQLTTEPVGVLSESIEGCYLNIVAGSSVRGEIVNCFRNAGIAIADQPITVQAMADAILTEPEKRSGCVFVDMGAETTSIALFKNNLLRHLAVIPLGGANINRDIMSLQIEEDEAEELKVKYGTAIADLENDHKPIALRDGRTVKYEDFSGLVEARVEEIVVNIKNQISLSKYDNSQLIGGIIVTGGASHIKELEQVLTRETQIEKVRFVHTLRLPVRAKDYPNFNSDGDSNAAIALIDKGNVNCCGGNIGQSDLFEQENAKAEADEKAREEAEAAAKAALEAEKKAREEEEERRREEEERIKREKEEAKRKKFEGIKSAFRKFGNTISGLVNDKED